MSECVSITFFRFSYSPSFKLTDVKRRTLH